MTKEEYNKHKKLIEEWGNGAKIQYYNKTKEEWVNTENPLWDYYSEYRIKPTKIEFEDCDFDDEEYSINEWGNISIIKPKDYKFEHRVNFIKDKEIAEAYSVLPKLIRLMNKYNEGWKPDYKYSDSKFGIYNFKDDLSLFESCYASRILIFKTAEIRNNFLKDHKDLIEIAKPLL